MKFTLAVLMLILPPLSALACPDLAVPESVQSYIDANHIPYRATDFKIVSEGKVTKCQLMSDFTGDGRMDYVAMLENTEDKYIYMVAFTSKGDTFEFQKLSTPLGTVDRVIWFYLGSRPPGLKLAQPRKLTTKLPSPVLFPEEEYSRTYYWLDGKFVEVDIDEDYVC